MRTDPEAPPHKVITMLLVPTSDPIDLGWVRAPDATLAVFAGVHAVRAVDPSGATLWEVRHGCWNSGCEEIHDAYDAYADRRDHRFPGSGSVGFSADGSLVRAHVRGPLPEGELS
ncbi:hypothetical protein GCM10010253_36400 [Streptomyces badius]|uniref:Uncharacterized protein n=1 Tax=Streptomyces badius TaxID=1941 RepID=A0ABQ2TCM0_STRBA|nr:hypothetical protein GCM10010253_36400 [Streptomyces badius]